MTAFALDHLAFAPDDVDLRQSPLAGVGRPTFVLGAFNPGLARLPSGNLLLMVRVAEALCGPLDGAVFRSLRWADGTFWVDEWPAAALDLTDPRAFAVKDQLWRPLGLTSLSWLLPVELSSDGTKIVDVHYERAIVPSSPRQCYGIEDPRISKVGDDWFMTVCSVSPERQSTTLYTSTNALDWQCHGTVLDHQNKDMLIFQGLVGGQYWAQTRPLGDAYFAYPPASEWLPGPSINLATSPDALHWKPLDEPGLRPRADTPASARMGGGAPPILTPEGWLTLWHGVEPGATVGVYRTYWALLDAHRPDITLYRSDPHAVLEPSPLLTAPMADRMYVDSVVFTTGIVDDDDHYLVASGKPTLPAASHEYPSRRLAAERKRIVFTSWQPMRDVKTSRRGMFERQREDGGRGRD